MTANRIITKDNLKFKLGESEFNISSKGAMIIGWKYKNQDIIPELHSKPNSTSLRGGVPICFPFFNASPPGMENIPQHGWLRNEELKGKIIQQTDDEVIVKFSKENQPLGNYPWQLKYAITHKLTRKTMETILEVERLSDNEEKDAPINPAFHPYFTIQQTEKTKIGNHRPQFSEDFYYQEIPLKDGTTKSEDEAIIIDTRGGEVEMKTEGFKVVCLWTDNLQEYACIEPVVDEHLKFNTPAGTFLKQGEKLKLKINLKIIKNFN
jgi:D-hexose-6-phosphate mutarotase